MAAIMCAAHTQVPENSTRQSTLSSLAKGRITSRASFFVATIRSFSTSSRPLSFSACLLRSITLWSMNGVPMGSSNPSLCTPYVTKPTFAWIICFASFLKCVVYRSPGGQGLARWRSGQVTYLL